MKILFPALMMAAVTAAFPALAADDSRTRCYELRTYHVAPGKMEALHQRFREHTLGLFARHGMTSLGYWVRLDKNGQPENKLTFLLSYPNREAREKSWKGFVADPEWQAAFKASEADGPLVVKVENPYLTLTDYSPVVTPTVSDPSRVYELRTYTCPPGRLAALHERFRNHTMGLFTKHGMTHFGYWTPMDKDKGAEDTLIYLLAHKSRDAAAESFKHFRDDPKWQKARKDSEDKAGGSLTAKDGVQSVFMTPTPYSPAK
jgi:hypothetical protein